jgi:hypothetical protein
VLSASFCLTAGSPISRRLPGTDAEPLAEQRPFRGKVAALAKDEIEGRIDRRARRAERDQQALSVQRIEGMARRHAEGNAMLGGGPHATAVGMQTLRRQFRRTLVVPVLEQAGEEHGNELDVERRMQLAEALQVQVGERRDEVEIPAGGNALRHIVPFSRTD